MKQPVSVSQFRRVLHSKYHLVVHKHKHFAQCQVCFQLRNEARKARTTSDKEYIATNRRYHYEIIFKERVVYHTTRSDAMADPHKVLSAIVDGCSQWKTALPRYARDMKISNFKAYGQKLIEPRVGLRPVQPTKAEIAEHYPLHLNYRSWCDL